MIMYKYARSVAGAFAACLLTAGVLAGCSDNAASPLPPDTDPLGNNATVKTSDPVSPQEANEVRTNVRKHANDTIHVQPDSAADIARREYPGGEVYSVNLDFDTDSADYEVVIKQNGRFYVVVIDPQTGAVKEKREISGEQVANIRVIVIHVKHVKVHEARARATSRIRGECVEVNLEEVDGKPTYVIIILTEDNRYVTIYIDAETGKERKLKDDGKCGDEDVDSDSDSDSDHGDKHKNKRGRGHYRHHHDRKGKGYGHKYHCSCECTDDHGTQIPVNVISLDSARSITRAMIDSARIVSVKLNVADTANITYDIKAARDSNTYDIRLNARTGALIEISQTGGRFDSSEFRPRVTGDTLVALSVARTAAVAQVVGAVQGWKLAYSSADARWIYTFRIRETTTGISKDVLVDAKTGAFIRIV